MKTRKFLAVLLAATCAASLAVPTFADPLDAKPIDGAQETDSKKLAEWSMTVTTALQTATLDVTLPNTTSVIINPYRMGIVVDDAGTKSYDTVLSPEMEIKNDSECAIMVGVKGQVTTYQKVDVTDFVSLSDADATVAKTELIDPAGQKVTITALGDVKVDNATKPKVFTDASGYVLTAKYTASTYSKTDNSLTKAGTLTITGYTASKDIKVATASLGTKVDTDTSNSMFVYAQGYLEKGKSTELTGKAVAASASNPAGQLVFTGNKDAEGKVLYLSGSETGYVKISGDVTTAPKTSWDTFDGLFATPFVFQIQAVANKKPVDPNVTGFKFETSIGSAPDATVTDGAATVTWTGTTALAPSEEETIAINAVETTGAKLTYALASSVTSSVATISGNVITLGGDAGNNVTIDVEVTAENIGKPAVTYTITITLKKATA